MGGHALEHQQIADKDALELSTVWLAIIRLAEFMQYSIRINQCFNRCFGDVVRGFQITTVWCSFV